jgi:hypothetical protein
VNQTRSSDEQQTAPGFELLAQALVRTRDGLVGLGLADEDLQDARTVADEASAEVAQPEPDRGRLRHAGNALKGALAPVGTGPTRVLNLAQPGRPRTRSAWLSSTLGE